MKKALLISIAWIGFANAWYLRNYSKQPINYTQTSYISNLPDGLSINEWGGTPVVSALSGVIPPVTASTPSNPNANTLDAGPATTIITISYGPSSIKVVGPQAMPGTNAYSGQLGIYLLNGPNNQQVLSVVDQYVAACE